MTRPIDEDPHGLPGGWTDIRPQFPVALATPDSPYTVVACAECREDHTFMPWLPCSGRRRRVRVRGKHQSMSQVLASLWQQIRISVTLFRLRAVQRIGIAAFVITVLAVSLAPDAAPSGWDWTRIILIVCTAMVALLCFLASRDPGVPSGDQQLRLFATAILVTLALLLNIVFGLGAAIAFSIGFTLIALLAQSETLGRTPWLLCGALGIVIPFWIWTALNAWHIGLLMLVPLGVIALISDAHMRDAAACPVPGPAPPSTMTARGHRLASRLGILAAAMLMLVAGLPGSGSSSWLAAGAAGAVIGVALEAGLPRTRGVSMGWRSVLLCDAALAWIAICWLASL